MRYQALNDWFLIIIDDILNIFAITVNQKKAQEYSDNLDKIEEIVNKIGKNKFSNSETDVKLKENYLTILASLNILKTERENVSKMIVLSDKQKETIGNNAKKILEKSRQSYRLTKKELKTPKIKIKGQFSEMFPKTFEYLRSYVKAKYPNHEGKIPDVRVIMTNKGFKNLTTGSRFHTFPKKIVVSIDQYVDSTEMQKRFAKDKNLLMKYFDTNNKTRGMLIHEFQHLLQRVNAHPLMTRQLKTNLPKNLTFKKVNTYLAIQNNKGVIATISLFLFGWETAFGLLLALKSDKEIIKRVIPQYHYDTSIRNEYLTDPAEIEANVAKMVFLMYKGISPESAWERSFGNAFGNEEKYFTKQIELTKSYLLSIERARRATKDRGLKIRYEDIIKKLRKFYYTSKRILKLKSRAIEEAKRIVEEMKNKQIN
jgi:hypothetical protein